MIRATSIALLLFASTAAAEVTTHETVVHKKTKSVDLKLDANTVLCSAADYGALHLKVLIPALANLTLLDHQNLGAGAPCVAAGPCAPGNMPSDILDPKTPVEKVSLTVREVRIDNADSVAQTCTTSLREEVAVTIRGKAFKHTRFSELGERPFSDCVTTDAKADEAETDEEDQPQDGGGCNTGGTTGGLLAVGIAALLVALRRRS
jgi:hypothetical protein